MSPLHSDKPAIYLVLFGIIVCVSSFSYEKVFKKDDVEQTLLKLVKLPPKLDDKNRTVDEKGISVSFSAFGENINLELFPASPHLSNQELPVTIFETDWIRTQTINFTEHGITFYEETDGLKVATIKQFYKPGYCFAMDAIIPRHDHYLILESIENKTKGCFYGLEGIQYMEHVVCRRWTKPTRHSVNMSKEDRKGELIKRFLVDGIAVNPDNVLPTKGSVNAKVEILAWTDFSYVSSFKNLTNHENVEVDILKYVATVVHFGTLMYKHAILDPSLKVSLYLTGAVICKVPECSKFTSGLLNNNTVDNYQALDKFSDTLREVYNNKSLHFNYDVAVAFTRYDLTDPNGTPVGVSNADDVCMIASGESSAIIEDQGGYSCIGTFVHEIAHILGSDHDGYFRGENCSAENGFLMSTIAPLRKSAFFFSQCTWWKTGPAPAMTKDTRENLTLAVVCHGLDDPWHTANPNASCVFNSPHENSRYEALVREFPGQLYNATEQCRQIYGTKFCLSVGTTLEDICHKMFCWDPYLDNVCSTKSAAAPGTSCGPKKWCLNGDCVHDERAP